MSGSNTPMSNPLDKVNQTSSKVNNFKFVNVTFDEGGNTKIDINGKKKRKPRPITSCDSCRRRKIGCANATLPCEPCVLYGEKCSLLPTDTTPGLTKPPEPRKTKPRKIKETEVESGSQGRTVSTGPKSTAQKDRIEDNTTTTIAVPPKKRPRKSVPEISTKAVSLSPVSAPSNLITAAQIKNQLLGQSRPSPAVHSQQQRQQPPQQPHHHQQQRSLHRVSDPYPRDQHPNQQPWQYSEARETPYLSHSYSNTTHHNNNHSNSGPSTGRPTHPSTHDTVPSTTQRQNRTSFNHEAPFLYSPSPESFTSTGSYGNEQAVLDEADPTGIDEAHTRKRSRSAGSMTSDHLIPHQARSASGGTTDAVTKLQTGAIAVDNRRGSTSMIDRSIPKPLFEAGREDLFPGKPSSENERMLPYPNMSNSMRQHGHQQYPNIGAGPSYNHMDGDPSSISSLSMSFTSTSRSTLANLNPSSDDSSAYTAPHPGEPSSVRRENPSDPAFTYSQNHSSVVPSHFAPKSRMPEPSYSILRDDLTSRAPPSVGYFSETTFQNPLLMSLASRSRSQTTNSSENQSSPRSNSTSHESGSAESGSGSTNNTLTQMGAGKDPVGVSKSRILPSSSTLSIKKPSPDKKSTVSSLAFLLQPWSPSNDKIAPMSKSPFALPDSPSPALSSSTTTSVKSTSGTGGKVVVPMGPPPVPAHRRQQSQGAQNENYTGSVIDLLKIPVQGKDEDRSKFEDAFKKSVGWILPWASDNLDGLGENARMVVWSLGARLVRWENEDRPLTSGNLSSLSKRYLHLIKARVALESFSVGKVEDGIKGLETACLIAWSESFSEDIEGAWVWCGLALQLAETLAVYSPDPEFSSQTKPFIASLSTLSTLLSLRHCRPSIFPLTLVSLLPASLPASTQDPLQAMSHLLSLLTPLLPILHAAKTGSDVPDEANKTVGAVLKGVYDFWGEMKAEGGVLSLSTNPTQTAGKKEKIESMGYGKKVLLETWVQGIFALLNSEDLLPPSILPDDHASEVALSATTSISTSLETISSLHHLRLAAISPLIDVPVQFALDLLKERARKAKGTASTASGGESQGSGKEDEGKNAGKQSMVEQQLQGHVELCTTFLAHSGKLLKLE